MGDRILDARIFWPSLLAYFILIGVLRAVLFPGASQDDADALVLSQTLAGGYNPAQPPLYIWLVHVAGLVVGPGLPSVLIVKYGCIFGLFAFLALAGAEMLRDPRKGRLAALGLFCLLYVGFDAVFNYSNSIVQATACAATLWAMARLGRTGALADYVLLGGFLGLGVLSKYGYLLFLGALLSAAATVPMLRARILSARSIATVAVAALLVAPYCYWLMTSGADLAASVGERLADDPGMSYREGLRKGLFNLLNGIATFLFPLFLIALALFPRAWLPLRAAGAAGEAEHEWRLVLARFFWIVVGMLLFAVVALGLTNVRTHYMFILLGAPIYLLLRADAAHARPWRYRAFAFASVLLALFWVVVLLGRFLWEPAVEKRPYFHFPYPALAEQLRKAGFDDGTILAHVHIIQIDGNLRAQFPQARVRSTKYPYFAPPEGETAPGACLLVWEQAAGEGLPAPLAALAASDSVRDLSGGKRGAATAPLRQSDRTFTLHYRLLPAQGHCG